MGGLGAVEVGGLGEALHQDIYLAGVWVAALEGTLEMADRMEDSEVLDAATRIAPTAHRTLNNAYWREQDGHHAFGILAGGGTNDNLTVWPAAAAAFGVFDQLRARLTLRRIAGDRISSDWGAHMLSTESPLYHPLQYNMGTVWPFVTGFASWGQYRYRRPWAGFHLMDAIKQMTFDFSLGRHGELFSGTFYEPLDQTVPHQFFATSMLVTPLLRGVFGWEPDAPNGRARLAPQLPADWPEAAVRGLRAGATTLDVEIVQEFGEGGGEQRVVIRGEGPPVEVDFVPDLPVGATGMRVNVEGTKVEGRAGAGARRRPGLAPLRVRVTEGQVVELVATWEGGLTVAPPRIDLEPGQRSGGPRVIDLVAGDDGWLLTVEGNAGREYDFALFGTAVDAEVVGGAAEVASDGNGGVRVRFSGDEGRVEARIHLTPKG
ncbi:MAG: hypothetical protein OXL34_15130 [Gemmatimonadota bacterium]|nr:hypothetical protein [Gemmatimonadota bacterium]